MSSLTAKDRVSLCSFTFSDGRRCRTPRIGKHPRFCPYHAQKEARARAAQTLGKDLAYFFSGDYLSACDLSPALARLIPAVVRGDVKPKTAHTVAYLVQTLLQAIHMSQHEYINAFGSDGWCKSIRNSVNHNYDYCFPPDPQPEPHTDQAPHVVAGLQTGRAQAPQPAPAAPPPHNSMPPTSAEFVQHVVAGLQTGGVQAPQPAQATQPTPAQTRSSIPAQAPSTPPTSAHAPESRAAQTAPSYLNHPAATTEKPKPIPAATQPAPSAAPTPQPDPPTAPHTPPPGPDRSAPWLDWGNLRSLRPDSKLL